VRLSTSCWWSRLSSWFSNWRDGSEHRPEAKESVVSLSGLLWLVIVVLVVLWLLGFVLRLGGDAVHVLLVIALVVIVINLLTGRRAV
jgi:hypothetical protein